jgi:hypothetical protein
MLHLELARLLVAEREREITEMVRVRRLLDGDDDSNARQERATVSSLSAARPSSRASSGAGTTAAGTSNP